MILVKRNLFIQICHSSVQFQAQARNRILYIENARPMPKLCQSGISSGGLEKVWHLARLDTNCLPDRTSAVSCTCHAVLSVPVQSVPQHLGRRGRKHSLRRVSWMAACLSNSGPSGSMLPNARESWTGSRPCQSSERGTRQDLDCNCSDVQLDKPNRSLRVSAYRRLHAPAHSINAWR